MSDARATPFHAATAGLNGGNRWLARNGFTLAADYGDVKGEALAAHVSAVLADISWRWRLRIEGKRTDELLSRLMTKEAAKLPAGVALKALWLSDGGGVRGAGAVARLSDDAYLLVASAPDFDWIAHAASLFEVNVADISAERGGLALIGPYAANILEAAGLQSDLEPLALRNLFWRGLDVTLARLGEHEGFELWCKADDALIAWERLMRAGADFGLRPAGVAAMDVLDIEKGIARPVRDYEPARDGFAPAPTPLSLGLESLIDSTHTLFNGHSAFLAAREKETKRLIGIEIESSRAAPKMMLQSSGEHAGQILASCYSPALRRAIALAQVEAKFAAIGTTFSLASWPYPVKAQAVELPFVKALEKSV